MTPLRPIDLMVGAVGPGETALRHVYKSHKMKFAEEIASLEESPSCGGRGGVKSTSLDYKSVKNGDTKPETLKSVI